MRKYVSAVFVEWNSQLSANITEFGMIAKSVYDTVVYLFIVSALSVGSPAIAI